jgi:hypothetical protein
MTLTTHQQALLISEDLSFTLSLTIPLEVKYHTHDKVRNATDDAMCRVTNAHVRFVPQEAEADIRVLENRLALTVSWSVIDKVAELK